MISFNSHPDWLAFLKKEIDSRHRVPAGALITVGLFPVQGQGTLFGTGKVVFRDAATAARGAFVYPAMTLAEEWVEGADAAIDRLRHLLTGDGAVAGQAVRGRFASTDVERNAHSSVLFTPWTEWNFTTAWHHEGPRPSFNNEPLLAFGLPPYPTTRAAVSEWIYGRPLSKGSDAPHMNQLHTILPDTRARIARAEWEHDELVVEVEANCDRQELELHAVFLDSQKDRHRSVRGPAKELRIPVPDDAGTLWIALVHSSGARLGETHLSAAYRSMSEERDATPLDEQVRQDLAGGESERVEFKPFIRANDPKEREIVKTVIAFANTAGGRILFGVDEDEGRLLGRGNMASALPPEKVRHPEARFRAWAGKLIADKVKPVPEFTAHLLDAHGEPVGVIDVKPGAVREKPFSTHENLIYVRKGATNRVPDQKTEWAAYFGKNSAADWTFEPGRF